METPAGYQYRGSELDLFAAATNWKAYLHSQLRPYLGSEVLEVGAGSGGTTRFLCSTETKRWICLEPDVGLASRLEALCRNGELPAACQVIMGGLGALSREHITRQSFDAILYVDVLEHIEDDASELQKAVDYLKAGGYLVILAPAHQWLYAPFDHAIGHFRRYTKASLLALTPRNTEIVRMIYLDAIGVVASVGNRLLLKRSMPTARQIKSWDKLMLPISRVVDPLFRYSIGKSVLAIWQKKKDVA